MGHDFSRQITKKCGTKYENGNYILGHPKWKWELYCGTEGVDEFNWNEIVLQKKKALKCLAWSFGVD